MVVPAAGASSMVNGAPGSDTPEIVSGRPPALPSVTVPAASVPTIAPPKDTAGGETVSCGSVPCPVPVRLNWKLPVLVVTVSTPPTTPGCAGLKSTGTVTVWPSVKSAGMPVPAVRAVNAAGEAVTDVTCTVPEIFSATFAVAFSPTVVVGNVVDGAWTWAVTGAPKPRTWPSRVPT